MRATVRGGGLVRRCVPCGQAHPLAKGDRGELDALTGEGASLRTPGVEPGLQAWEACMMPLHYVRLQ